MFFFSIIYILGALSFYALQFGDSSLVYANIINLSSRVVWSLHFVTSYFQSRGGSIKLAKVVPGRAFLIVSAFSAVLVRYSESTQQITEKLASQGKGAIFESPFMIHTALGLTLAMLCVLTWWTSSGRYFALRDNGKLE